MRRAPRGRSRAEGQSSVRSHPFLGQTFSLRLIVAALPTLTGLGAGVEDEV